MIISCSFTICSKNIAMDMRPCLNMGYTATDMAIWMGRRIEWLKYSIWTGGNLFSNKSTISKLSYENDNVSFYDKWKYELVIMEMVWKCWSFYNHNSGIQW